MNYVGMQVRVMALVNGTEQLVWADILEVRESAAQGVDVVTTEGTVQYCFPEMLADAVQAAGWGGTRWALENVGCN